jgi:uncharacterized phage protein gp47/JayE
VALNLPTKSTTVKDRIKTDISTRLILSNPFIDGSWLKAFAESLGERMFDFYFTITQAIEEIFPDTTFLNLDRWGSFYNTTRMAALKSQGIIILQATQTGSFVFGRVVVAANGARFICTSGLIFKSKTVVQNTLAHVAGLATFTGTTDHHLNTGDSVIITGAADVAYNGTFTIVATANDVFTYLIPTGSPASTTGGTFTHFSATAPIQSIEQGKDQNLAPFELLTLETPLNGVSDDCGVDELGATGGADRESIESFRARLLDIIRNPVAHFNVSDITRVAKTVALVTRVFVKEATPADGQVTIYPMVDNENNPIPGSGTTTAVKNAILLIKPANTSDNDVIVTAPSSVSTAFIFTSSSLNPNTITMRAAIEENLKQFFSESVEVGVNVTEDSYRAAIFQTVDTENGDAMIAFALSAPSGNLVVTSAQIRTLGAVTYV